MKNRLVFILLMTLLSAEARSQGSIQLFDTTEFNNRLHIASEFVDYEYFMQVSLKILNKEHDISDLDWFCFFDGKTWHTVGGTCTNREFSVKKHITLDSLYKPVNFKGIFDSAKIIASGCALSTANMYFQLVRDTTSIYFNSYVRINPDGSISTWFLPAFQPSGQAIYGCEWEYIFDETGSKLLSARSFTGSTTGIWIGQPREIWLNYRNTDTPPVGSLFFALSFRDFFTRLRIDTRTSTSTTAKNNNGDYTWSHSLKQTTH